jgi:hypothetical protein
VQTRRRVQALACKRRTVGLLHTGTRLRAFSAVVGAPRTPTPHGLFAVYERVPLADPNGFFGPWALHLTALSNVLATYDGGPGLIAIHGRGGTSLRDPLGNRTQPRLHAHRQPGNPRHRRTCPRRHPGRHHVAAAMSPG